MPEPEDSAPGGLHLPASDPAASAVEALRAMATPQSVEANAELAAFLEDPAGQGLGTTPHSRSDLVTVVRLPIRRVGRTAVAVGAALALATLGGVAVAATGGGQDREPAQVQQDDPSDTTTTTETTETTGTTGTETTTAEPEETESSDTESSDTAEASTAPHTANAAASANHHDGVGADDAHADVNGGGEVDHRAQHSPTAHPTGGGDDSDQADDAEQGGDAGTKGGAEAPDSPRGGGPNRR